MPIRHIRPQGEQDKVTDAKTPTEEGPTLEKLRAAIAVGIAELDAGHYTEVDDEHLDAYLDSLAEQARVYVRTTRSSHRRGP